MTGSLTLTPSDGAAGDQFGMSVSLSADGLTAIVGGCLDDVGANVDQGSARVFDWNGASWVQRGGALTPIDGAAGDYFGWSASLSADGLTAIVGGYSDKVGANTDQGSARVFVWNGSSWVQRGGALTPSDGAAGDRFGFSVSLSADGLTAILSGPYDNVGTNQSQGSARVFDWNGTAWVQRGGALTPIDGAAGDAFGDSVSLSADGLTAIVGGRFGDVGANVDQGSACVFDWNGTAWMQRGTAIAPSDGETWDNFGISVSLSADGLTAIVGGPWDDAGVNDSQGSARVFYWNGTAWMQRGEALNDSYGGRVGYSVSLSADGLTAIVGILGSLGSARVFDWDGASWVQRGGPLIRSNGDAREDFISVSLSADGLTAIVGGPGDDVGANGNQGSARIFGWNGTAWVEGVPAAAPNSAPSINSNGGGVSASISVLENSTAVTTVTASDPDVGATLTYSISGGADAAKFRIDGTTGFLSFASSPNFEAPTDVGANNVYDVTVKVSDGTLTDTQSLAVTVTNVNEAPVINSNGGGISASIFVQENSTAVTTVNAIDPDASTTLTYSIVGGTDATKFVINSSTGALRFITPPDFEAPTDFSANNIYDVTVQASDGELSDTQDLAINVLDPIGQENFGILRLYEDARYTSQIDPNGRWSLIDTAPGAPIPVQLFDFNITPIVLAYQANSASPEIAVLASKQDFLSVQTGRAQISQGIASFDIVDGAFTIETPLTAIDGYFIFFIEAKEQNTLPDSIYGLSQALYGATSAVEFRAALQAISSAELEVEAQYVAPGKTITSIDGRSNIISVDVRSFDQFSTDQTVAFSPEPPQEYEVVLNQNFLSFGSDVYSAYGRDGYGQMIISNDGAALNGSYFARVEKYDGFVSVSDDALIRSLVEAETAASFRSAYENLKAAGFFLGFEYHLQNEADINFDGVADQNVQLLLRVNQIIDSNEPIFIGSDPNYGPNNYFYDIQLDQPFLVIGEGTYTSNPDQFTNFYRADGSDNTSNGSFSMYVSSSSVNITTLEQLIRGVVTAGTPEQFTSAIAALNSAGVSYGFDYFSESANGTSDDVNNSNGPIGLSVSPLASSVGDQAIIFGPSADIFYYGVISQSYLSISEGSTNAYSWGRGTYYSDGSDNDFSGSISFDVNSFSSATVSNFSELVLALKNASNAAEFDVAYTALTQSGMDVRFRFQKDDPVDINGDGVVDFNVTFDIFYDPALNDGSAIKFSLVPADYENNSAPIIVSATAVVVPENISSITAAYTVNAYDYDSNVVIISYSLVGGVDSSLFKINQYTGAVTFKTSPDFENPQDQGGNNIYDIVVQASDGLFSSQKTVAITVEDQLVETGGGTTGDDIFVAAALGEAFDGKSGNDTVSYYDSPAGLVANLNSPQGNTGYAQGDTYLSIENLIGSAFNDVITGDLNANVIEGRGGGDTLNGGAGADDMSGGAGDDTYILDNIGDRVFETTTISSLIDAGGVDTIQSSVSASLNAAAGVRFVERLTLTGAANINGDGNALDNVLTGNAGNNTLFGLGGNDTLDGGAGTDGMSGGSGDDAYIVDNVGDRVYETTTPTSGIDAGGVDTIQSSVTTSLDAYAGVRFVENLTLTGVANINGTGNALANVLTGNAGNNTLSGLGGNDTLDGGAGTDGMSGGSGDDTYVVDNIGDRVYETTTPSSGIDSGGLDTVLSSVTMSLDVYDGVRFVERLTLTGAANINGTGNGLANVLTGNAGNNTLNGGLGNDTMVGGLGNDMLDGGAGTDGMSGGSGDDTYFVDNGGDRVYETTTPTSGIDSGGVDTIRSSLTTNLDAYAGVRFVERLTLTGTANLNGTGNALENVLTGNAGNNTLSGLGGNDTLDGGAGTDGMSGGSGDDTYIVDNIGDRVYETTTPTSGIDTGGVDTVLSSVTMSLDAYAAVRFVENLTLTGATHINGFGNALDNVLNGNSGNNTLDGGLGNDTMGGGAGNDTYVVDSASDFVFETTTVSSLIDAGGIDTIQSSVALNLGANAGLRFVERLTLTGAGNINGDGNALANVLLGNSGNNTLDGGLGVDLMVGGAGNDTYVVDNAGDRVFETTTVSTQIDAGGVDTMLSSISTSIDAYIGVRFVENLTLTGTANLVAVGNALDNVLLGNTGNNTLNGGLGADTMGGGAGNDTYVVDNVGDQVFETTTISSGIDAGGVDTIQSSVTQNLDANAGLRFVERLTLTGTGNINGTGNALANVLLGNSGNNTLNGGLGADIMGGGAGNDTYIVNSASDFVFETTTISTLIDAGGVDTIQSSVTTSLDAGVGVRFVENLTLTGAANINGTGNALANVLTGNDGNNTLNGGRGNDILIGGLGVDTFVFNTALGASNLDQITGFSVVDDTIRLDDAIFVGLTPGNLAGTAIAANLTGEAATDFERIIYETDTGALFYDSDGVGTLAARVQFATLSPNLALTNSDFFVI